MKKNLQEIPPLYFTNTLTRKKELFVPLKKDGTVSFYSCGPTVWNRIHIGNLRGGVVSDLIFRFLTYIGYDVHYARNYTDIDDRIIEQSKVEKCDWKEISEKYLKFAHEDYQAAFCLPPTTTPRATEFIPEMIQDIELLIQKGHAYATKDGTVFFGVQSFKEYGKLSKRDVESMETIARVETNPEKKNPIDFALWKAAKPGEPFWETPWGKGRPGWHIECSAMVRKILGPHIDLHHGGEDLTFPHHENEIAQAECCEPGQSYVQTWIHHGFLTLSNEKMSKSLGNVFLAHDFIQQFSGEVSRFLLLSVHHKSTLEFSKETVDKALNELSRIYEAKAQASALLNNSQIKMNSNPLKSELENKIINDWKNFSEEIHKTQKEIISYLCNDLNTPEVFGSLFILIRTFNRLWTESQSMINTKIYSEIQKASESFLSLLKNEMGEIFCIGLQKPEDFFVDLNRMKVNRDQLQGKTVLLASEIEKLLEERILARQNKDFKKSDEIRNHLLNNGVEIKDSTTGTSWSYK